jgi:inner membrane protein
MASAITHFIVGGALALPALRSAAIREVLPRWAIPVSAGLLAVAPDLDTFAMRAFQIPFGSFFGHRGFWHSPFFLVLFSAALAACVAGRRSKRTVVYLAVMWAGCAVTHPLLDALTDGGSGVMLLFPFSQARLFFPWRPIHVSPLSILRFFTRAGYILRSDAPFCVGAIAIGVSGLLAQSRLSSSCDIMNAQCHERR